MLTTTRWATLAGELIQCLRHAAQSGLSQAIKDVPAFAPVRDQTRISQSHQVLRNVRLPQAERRFHVANTLLSILEQVHDGEACGMAESPADPGFLRIDRRDSTRRFHNIQVPEYDCME